MEQNIKLTSAIVTAYVTRNHVAPYDLSKIITNVYVTLTEIALIDHRGSAAPTALIPAISVRKSVTPDYIVSLEDGCRYKLLKGHLKAKYNMTPNQYRKRWGLPANYPMVAPNYAATRSSIARHMGFGNIYGKTPLRGSAKMAG